MIKAILFDYDGTISDTIPVITEAVNLTMQALGFPPHSPQSVVTFINGGARELVRRSLPEEKRTDEDYITRALEIYLAFYDQVCLHTKHTYEGMRELIRDLHDTGIRIGVLSNKDHHHVVGLAEQNLLPGSYDAVQGPVKGCPTKPHPFLSEKIAAALGVRTEECVLIGDSDVDVKTAANAGMRHIGVTWGYRTEEDLRRIGATCFAHTTEELRERIAQQLQS